MAKQHQSKAGWLDRRREKQREKQLRTGDSPEKAAERSKRHDPTAAENGLNPGAMGFLSGGG